MAANRGAAAFSDHLVADIGQTAPDAFAQERSSNNSSRQSAAQLNGIMKLVGLF